MTQLRMAGASTERDLQKEAAPMTAALLADCYQMRNFGRPGYEHEWAPSEHVANNLALAQEASPPEALASTGRALHRWYVDGVAPVVLVVLAFVMLVWRRRVLEARERNQDQEDTVLESVRLLRGPSHQDAAMPTKDSDDGDDDDSATSYHALLS
ncbi:Aste57867_9430 [Aphanomyces stellatus]|uniref:Aste57867_9430 protein n=1 Tax=Aphanomyces stellatus TaxID=120398 RepID=A0A485KN00_9STRA|nr:hypothetical protein As57867_009394 [Aphanomyces stellatus]VFT86310.1 Aste57867_9430 [Aphanomyces stellatus]